MINCVIDRARRASLNHVGFIPIESLQTFQSTSSESKETGPLKPQTPSIVEETITSKAKFPTWAIFLLIGGGIWILTRRRTKGRSYDTQ